MSSQAAAKLLRKAWGQGLNGLRGAQCGPRDGFGIFLSTLVDIPFRNPHQRPPFCPSCALLPAADGLPGVSAISASQATAAETGNAGFGAAGFTSSAWGGAPSLNGGAPQWGGWTSFSSAQLGGAPMPIGLPALPVIAESQQRVQTPQQQGLTCRNLTSNLGGLPVHGLLGLGSTGSRVIADGEQVFPTALFPFGNCKDATPTRELLASLSLFDPAAAAAASDSAALESGRAAAAQQPSQQRMPLPAMGAGAAGRRTRGSSSSVALNKEIMAAATVEELLNIVRTKSAQFDFFNISSAVSRAPKLVEQAHYHGHGAAAHHAAEIEASLEAMHTSTDGATATATQQHVGHLSPAAQELADRLCALVGVLHARDGG